MVPAERRQYGISGETAARLLLRIAEATAGSWRHRSASCHRCSTVQAPHAPDAREPPLHLGSRGMPPLASRCNCNSAVQLQSCNCNLNLCAHAQHG